MKAEMDITDEDIQESHRFSTNSLSDDDQEDEDHKDSQQSSISQEDSKHKEAANQKIEKPSKIRRKGHCDTANFTQN